jgi:lipopolysaccharide export LptBFGC system permease protein LptF
MKLIDRYVLGLFLKNYVISLMVLVGMYVVLDTVFNFQDLVDIKGRRTADDVSVLTVLYNIGYYYFFQIFLIFVYLSGMIPVVAAAFTLMRLSRFNELTALLAAGVPLLRVAAPVILASVALNGLLIADQELAIPRMIPILMRDHDERATTDVKSFPIMAMQDQDRSLLRVGKFTPASDRTPATMQVVDVTERREAVRREVGPDGKPQARRVMEPVSHLSADSATWNAAERRWDLVDGWRKVGLTSDDLGLAREPVAFYQSNVTPEEIALYHSGDWVELLSTPSLQALIDRPGSYGQAHLLRVKHTRFFQPIMNVVLLLLAIPCVLTREPGKLKSAATKCLALTGLGMGAMFLSHQLAAKPPTAAWAQTWPALVAFAPVVVFFTLATFLLSRIKT